MVMTLGVDEAARLMVRWHRCIRPGLYTLPHRLTVHAEARRGAQRRLYMVNMHSFPLVESSPQTVKVRRARFLSLQFVIVICASTFYISLPLYFRKPVSLPENAAATQGLSRWADEPPM